MQHVSLSKILFGSVEGAHSLSVAREALQVSFWSCEHFGIFTGLQEMQQPSRSG
jgi:hypothetical protein